MSDIRETRLVARAWITCITIICVAVVAVVLFGNNPHLIFGR